MADAPDAAAESTETPQAPRPGSRAARAAERSTLLAELAQHETGREAEAPRPKVAAPAKSPAPTEDDAGETAEEAGGDDDAADPVEARETEPEEPDDPDTSRRLDKVNAAEKRMRAKFAREREEMRAERDRERAELKPRLDRLDAFEKLTERAKYDIVPVLKALGISEDDLAPLSREIYAHSSEGAKDPKYKDAATRSAKERADQDRVAKLERELEELRTERKTEREQAETERTLTTYIDGVTKAVTEDTPLVKQWLDKAPKKARAALLDIANELAAEGEVPEAADVVAALEKRRRADLEELGVAVPAAKPKAKPDLKDPPKKPAPKGPSVRVRARGERDDLLQELAEFQKRE